MVGDAGSEFEHSVVGVELHLVVHLATTFHIPYYCGADADGPSLGRAEVEVEIKTGLGGKRSSVLSSNCIFSTTTKEVVHTGTGKCFDFEETGSAFVAAEEV